MKLKVKNKIFIYHLKNLKKLKQFIAPDTIFRKSESH